MRIKTAKFITSACGLTDCPKWDRPEIALIGRSNVGKSSMVNLLANKDGLAKVSGSPGKTRQINFFLINESWSLVDLPGYGFAKAAKHEKFDFNQLVGDYLEQRENLRRVFVLIDSRHPPQRIDLDFTAWLAEINAPFSLVFTKADKQSPAKTRANAALFLETAAPLFKSLPEALACSAKNGHGRDEILRFISGIIAG